MRQIPSRCKRQVLGHFKLHMGGISSASEGIVSIGNITTKGKTGQVAEGCGGMHWEVHLDLPLHEHRNQDEASQPCGDRRAVRL